jgi:S1-C subfamily serine protease
MIGMMGMNFSPSINKLSATDETKANFMGIAIHKLATSLALVAVGVGMGWGASQYLPPLGKSLPNRSQNDLSKISVAPVRTPSISLPVPQQDINFIVAAAQKVGPAVVRIDADRQISSLPPELQNPANERYMSGIPSRERVETGTGAGVIISGDGKVITNAHVVKGTNTVKVILTEGQTLTGKVIGIDRVTDLAVVKIEGQNLPTANLGDSNKLTPGEWAIAIGNPLGLDRSVTLGIISATGRTSTQVGIPDKRVRFIQTDAAINPGNSGGPLINVKGEVIGINTAIRADAQGLGFAIPIQTAIRITNSLFARGRVDHPYLGIETIALNSELKEGIDRDPLLRNKVRAERGAIVMKVVPHSPAAKSDLRPGDTIVKIGNQPIGNSQDVQEQVEVSTIGQNLPIEVMRGRELHTINIKPGIFPNNDDRD